LIAAVVFGLCAALWPLVGPLVEQRVGLPLLYLLRGPVAPSDKVAVVALDERTVDDLALDAPALASRRPAAAACMPSAAARALAGARNIETMPRAVHACLIARLREAGARAIVLDVHFKVQEDPADDAFLALAMLDAGVVRILEEIARDPVTGAVTRRAPAAPFQRAAAGTGFFAVADDPAGAVAHVMRFGGFPAATPVYAPLLPPSRSQEAPLVRQNGVDFALFNLPGPPGWPPTIRLADVLDGVAPAETFRDAVVFVGAAEPGGVQERDSFVSVWPFGPARVAGVELMAVAYLNGREQSWLRKPPAWAQALQALGAAAAMAALGVARGWRGPAGVAAVALTALAAAALAFATLNLWTPAAFPVVVAAPAALVGALVARYVASRVSLRRLLPAPLGIEMEASGAHVAAAHSVLFLDLAGSTRYGDSFGAEALRRRLDHVFDIAVAAVEGHAGFVVKFTGDGCLALFAEQSCAGRDADCALAAAADIAAALREMNAESERDSPIRLRIGVQSGHVIVAYVGAASRGVVDAVGDAVNTAARLEDLCRTLFPGADVAVAVGHDAAARLTPGRFTLSDHGDIALRGKSQPLRVFGLRFEQAGEVLQ
jgi:adenylate cyclase